MYFIYIAMKMKVTESYKKCKTKRKIGRTEMLGAKNL